MVVELPEEGRQLLAYRMPKPVSPVDLTLTWQCEMTRCEVTNLGRSDAASPNAPLAPSAPNCAELACYVDLRCTLNLVRIVSAHFRSVSPHLTTPFLVLRGIAGALVDAEAGSHGRPFGQRGSRQNDATCRGAGSAESPAVRWRVSA